MVWSGIILNGRTDLHVFASTTAHVETKHTKYEVLDPHVKLFKVSIGNNFLLMNDNTLPHHAAQVTDYLEKEEFQ